MFSMNIKNNRYKMLSCLVFLVVAMSFSFSVIAKTDESEQPPPFDIEKAAYPDNKKGCEMRAGMFVLFSKKYKEGKPSEGVLLLKMADPLSDKIYDRIRANGLEAESINNMKAYSKCIKSASVHKNAKKERDLTLKHTACVQLNDVILDTLDGIKRRRKPESLMAKYQNVNIDTTWTNYAIIPNTALYLIAKLYKTSQNEDYETVVQTAANMSSHCYL